MAWSRCIPVCAGPTPDCSISGKHIRVYSCVCRADYPGLKWAAKFDGLPLLMQGQPQSTALAWECYRSTPACAGRTEEGQRLVNFRAVYPCVCRANNRTPGACRAVSGLPLRVQGERDGGNLLRCRLWVYPCVCRANIFAKEFSSVENGLPLRVQGEQESLSGIVQIRRSTPACAGRTRI